MRCDGPAGLISRVSAEPVEVAGHTFPAGERFYLGLNASNRDPCLRVVLERCPDLRPGYETPDWRPVMPLGHHLDSLWVKL